MKLAMSNRDIDIILVQLVNQSRKRVELRIGEEFDEMGAVARRDVVALQVATDVSEGNGVAVDVEGFDLVGRRAGFGGEAGLLELAEEVLGEVGGCLGDF